MQIAFSYLSITPVSTIFALIEEALHVVRRVGVVQRGGVLRVAVAAREIDAHHEVQLQPRANELQERRFLLEHAFREGQRAFGGFAGEGERLVLALEERRRGGVDAAHVAMAAVAFVLEELDEDGAVLRVRIKKKGEKEYVVAVAENGKVDGELAPVARGRDFGFEDGDGATFLGLG